MTLRDAKENSRAKGDAAKKGSHTKWSHPKLKDKVVLSGNDGADAKAYQEKDVNNFLRELEEKQ